MKKTEKNIIRIVVRPEIKQGLARYYEREFITPRYRGAVLNNIIRDFLIIEKILK